jgi:predicted transposase/invertase (TIGR01784 family)
MGQKLVRFDWAIKRLLRSKANFGILEGFLSELLKQDLKIVDLLESESNKREQDGKQNRVDILVRSDKDEMILIEVQVNNEIDYLSRMLYGVSTIIVEQLKQGEKYANIKKVYSINLLYFDLGIGEDYIYHGSNKFVGLYKQDELSLSNIQKDLYNKNTPDEVYPEYYLIKVNQFDDIAKNTLDEWIYFLKNEEIGDNFKAKGLLEARNVLNELKLTDSEKVEYKRYLDGLHYEASMWESSYGTGMREGEKFGIAIGIEKGKIEGKIEGEQIGIVKGKIEGEINAKVEVAKKMKEKGMPIEDIRDITGLSIKELEKL